MHCHKAPLIAKLGGRKEYHFAHSEKLCNEGQAYIQGMYLLAKEIMDSEKSISLPGIKIAYEYSISPPIDINNITKHISFLSPHAIDQKHIQYISIFNETAVSITESYIKYKHNRNIEALIVKVGKKKLAIKIALPPTVCRDYKSKPVKGISTLEVDFRNNDYELNTLTKKGITQLITKDLECKSWISNLKAEEAYPSIIERNNEFIEKKNNELKKKKLEEIAWLKEFEAEAKRKQKEIDEQSAFSIHSYSNAHSNRITQDTKSDIILERGYKEIRNNFDINSDEAIMDSYGNRWIYCTLCGKIKHIDKMAKYGGIKPNIGKCNECFR